MTDYEDNGKVDFYLYGIAKKTAQLSFFKVPVHNTCAKKIRNRFLIHFLPIVLIIVCIVVFNLFSNLSTLLFISIAIIVAVIFFYFELINPVPVEFYYDNSKQRYVLSFSNKSYADIFARRNNSVAKVNNNYNPVF